MPDNLETTISLARRPPDSREKPKTREKRIALNASCPCFRNGSISFISSRHSRKSSASKWSHLPPAGQCVQAQCGRCAQLQGADPLSSLRLNPARHIARSPLCDKLHDPGFRRPVPSAGTDAQSRNGPLGLPGEESARGNGPGIEPKVGRTSSTYAL